MEAVKSLFSAYAEKEDALVSTVAGTLPPELAWGLYLRLIGVVYIVAHGALAWQIKGLAGSRGIAPIEKILAKQTEHMPSLLKRVIYYPTFHWFLGTSDFVLVGVAVTGAASGAAAIYGGPWSPFFLLVAHLCLLSLDVVVDLVYPWDSMLLETGWLVALMPALHPLTVSVAATSVPTPLLAFAQRYLVFRLLFGFGKLKFTGTRPQDRLYIKNFYINMPIDSPIGYFAHFGPDWFHRLSLGIMWLIEMPLPFLAFFTGIPRFICGVGIMKLQLGIQATGNFGYFNLLTFVQCLPLFHLRSDVFADTSFDHMFGSASATALTLYLIFTWVSTVFYLPLNSWCTQGWTFWPGLTRLSAAWVRGLVDVYRLAAPWRFVNSYGVFPPNTMPPARWVVVFEGSDDGDAWRRYHYKYVVTDVKRSPSFVAPYHPRLDHAIFYDAVGMNGSNFLGPMGHSSPYRFSRSSTAHRIIQRLLEGSQDVLGLFGANPFPEAPPKYVRASLYMFRAATPAHLRATGEWWTELRMGTHLPSQTLDDKEDVWARWLPEPESMFWEMDSWVRRIGTTSAAVTQRQYDAFWDTYMPRVRELAAEAAAGLGVATGVDGEQFSWDTLPYVAARLRDDFSAADLRAYDLTLARLTAPCMALLRDAVRVYGAPGDMATIRKETELRADGTPQIDEDQVRGLLNHLRANLMHADDARRARAAERADRKAAAAAASASPNGKLAQSNGHSNGSSNGNGTRQRRRSTSVSRAPSSDASDGPSEKVPGASTPASRDAEGGDSSDGSRLDAATAADLFRLTEPFNGPLRSQFHLGLLLHWMFVQPHGQLLFEATVGGKRGANVVGRRLSTTMGVGSSDPCASGLADLVTAASVYAPSCTRRRGLFLMSTVWYEVIACHATKAKLVNKVTGPSGVFGSMLSGFLEFLPELAVYDMRVLRGVVEADTEEPEWQDAPKPGGARAFVESRVVPKLTSPLFDLDMDGNWTVTKMAKI